MNSDFLEAFNAVMELEGGFTLHKNKTESDVTYAGIYRVAHPSWSGWSAIDKGLTPDTDLVREFYYENYYKEFALLEPSTAALLFEAKVNMGATAIKLAQRVSGVSDDGIFGAKSAAAIAALDKEHFTKSFALARIAYYNHLAAKERYRPYLRGWINRTMKSLEVM